MLRTITPESNEWNNYLLISERHNLNPAWFAKATPLVFVSYMNHTKCVRYLVHEGARDGNYGTAPVLAACEKGHLEVLRILLEDGNVESEFAGDEDGQTPLLEAASSG